MELLLAVQWWELGPRLNPAWATILEGRGTVVQRTSRYGNKQLVKETNYEGI
jgi:hypothetical protein